jgi:SnoaL-like domain
MPGSQFKAAIESGLRDGDREALAAAVEATLAEDIVFNSPVVFRPYEGRDAVMMVLRAVFDVFEDFRYEEEFEAGDRHALIFRARVGDRELQGLDLLRLDGDGKVAELTVMVRPMSGMLALAEAMKAKLEAAGAA